ncbi:MAG: hypothetical protein R3C97_14335 [Geminicoccaceae bacterium]
MKMLKASTRRLPLVLEADGGVSAMLVQDGRLERTVLETFGDFENIWREVRASREREIDLSAFGPLRATCDRRAVLFFTELEKNVARAEVVSLITGERIKVMHLEVPEVDVWR